MSIAWLIYLAEVVGNISTALSSVIGVTVVASLFGVIMFPLFMDMLDIEKIVVWKFAKMAAIVLAILISIRVFIPESKTVYLMAAASVGQEMATSPVAKDIGGKLYKILNDKLDEMVEEIGKKK